MVLPAFLALLALEFAASMDIQTNSEVSEAAHEFGALNTLLLVVILGVCIMCAYLIKSNNFYYLPESGACLIIGVVVGGMARLLYPDEKELEFLSFQPELFFFMLLRVPSPSSPRCSCVQRWAGFLR